MPKVWQPTGEGFSEDFLRRMWAKVEKRADGHWIWTGATVNGYPTMTIGPKQVGATRVVYAVVRQLVDRVPTRLYHQRECTDKRCVNPDCMLEQFEERPPPVSHHGPLSIPPLIETMAALQFGIEPEHKHVFYGRDEPAVGSMPPVMMPPPPVFTPDAIKEYTPDADMALHNALDQQAREQPVGRTPPTVTRQELMDLLFTPGTIVQTFPGGTVWIHSPQGRVQGDSPMEAIMAALTLSGRRQVKA